MLIAVVVALQGASHKLPPLSRVCMTTFPTTLVLLMRNAAIKKIER
jgi:hypothetical protein